MLILGYYRVLVFFFERDHLLSTFSDAVAEHCPNLFFAFTVYFPLSSMAALWISSVYTFLDRLNFMFDEIDICKDEGKFK